MSPTLIITMRNTMHIYMYVCRYVYVCLYVAIYIFVHSLYVFGVHCDYSSFEQSPLTVFAMSCEH